MMPNDGGIIAPPHERSEYHYYTKAKERNREHSTDKKLAPRSGTEVYPDIGKGIEKENV